MKTFRISVRRGAERSVIECRKNALGALKGAAGERKAFVLTDENVLRLYGAKLMRALGGASVYAMKAGEAYKNGETLLSVLGAMAAAELTRGDVLVAFGGGVVGDMGGLAAALYMRGIACIQVPTTLLAQVDSSVGGKTAVDLAGVKNLAGVIRQPERVLVDTAFLATLPPREIRCGLGEIVKHAALCGALFDKVWAQRDDLENPTFLKETVPENIAFKADVVRRDADEQGLRKCLNLGHTTAHAYELEDGALSHGEYVLFGIAAESVIAERRLACDGEYLGRLRLLCRRALGSVPSLPPAWQAALRARSDKKNRAADRVTLTVPVRKGEYALLELPFAEYADGLAAAAEELC